MIFVLHCGFFPSFLRLSWKIVRKICRAPKLAYLFDETELPNTMAALNFCCNLDTWKKKGKGGFENRQSRWESSACVTHCLWVRNQSPSFAQSKPGLHHQAAPPALGHWNRLSLDSLPWSWSLYINRLAPNLYPSDLTDMKHNVQHTKISRETIDYINNNFLASIILWPCKALLSFLQDTWQNIRNTFVLRVFSTVCLSTLYWSFLLVWNNCTVERRNGM